MFGLKYKLKQKFIEHQLNSYVTIWPYGCKCSLAGSYLFNLKGRWSNPYYWAEWIHSNKDLIFYSPKWIFRKIRSWLERSKPSFWIFESIFGFGGKKSGSAAVNPFGGIGELQKWKLIWASESWWRHRSGDSQKVKRFPRLKISENLSNQSHNLL